MWGWGAGGGGGGVAAGERAAVAARGGRGARGAGSGGRRRRSVGDFALHEEDVTRIDPVRVGDPGVGFPQLRPEQSVAAELLGQGPEGVALLDGVGLRSE